MSTDFVKWKKRASLMYAVGIWTMIGAYGYYRFQHKDDPAVEIPEEKEETSQNVKKFKSSYVSSTIVYKENFVPYSTRLLNFFRPTTENSSESQTHEK